MPIPLIIRLKLKSKSGIGMNLADKTLDVVRMRIGRSIFEALSRETFAGRMAGGYCR
ncbi:hypothetical protein [Zwartia sp.]|uniref:hypothetical protein n=1 Tax=Zwartia sp. TaxID=2978004 RepID=UPI0028B18E2A|nr:hypothetical protein [Zwartia sp.]